MTAALSLPHDRDDKQARGLETLRFTTGVAAAMPGGRPGVFREPFARRFPINLGLAANGGGLESAGIATYHLLRVVPIDPALRGRLTDRARAMTSPNGATVLDLPGRDPAGFEHFLQSVPSGRASFSIVRASRPFVVETTVIQLIDAVL